VTRDARWVILEHHANMILRKRKTNNLEEYQWVNEGTDEESPWMDLDNALIWIKEHDESKETN
jgi:hypothetical protein